MLYADFAKTLDSTTHEFFSATLLAYHLESFGLGEKVARWIR